MMSAKTGTLKILIADDHAGMRGIIRRSCADLAGEFIECENGEAAVKMFADESPDWVIMDVQMPGMDGFDATAAIRRLDVRARVILISQFSEPEYAERALHAGAVSFVSKEDMSRLAGIIRGQSPFQS